MQRRRHSQAAPKLPPRQPRGNPEASPGPRAPLPPRSVEPTALRWDATLKTAPPQLPQVCAIAVPEFLSTCTSVHKLNEDRLSRHPTACAPTHTPRTHCTARTPTCRPAETS
eukprot:scaffold26353_cov68-Phaeocystis_antarctica.AAC.1